MRNTPDEYSGKNDRCKIPADLAMILCTALSSILPGIPISTAVPWVIIVVLYYMHIADRWQ
jgi:hypothetical protein